MSSFLEKISCIIVAGGIDDGCKVSSTVEVISKDFGNKKLPDIPQIIDGPSVLFQDGAVLLVGGLRNDNKCLQLNHGTWREHSTLNKERYCHSVATTESGIFLFGGATDSYEYLPKGSTTWLMGKTEIPKGLWYGCAIAVKSDQEIWLIGGMSTEKRILSFNVNDHTFKILPSKLNVGRRGHKYAYIPNTKKVMITGGSNSNSTEILDAEDGGVTIANPMNSRRCKHGIGVLTFKDEDRLAVFGGGNGYDILDSVETYNSQTETWETSDIKLNEPKCGFGFLTVKLSNIISELQCTRN